MIAVWKQHESLEKLIHVNKQLDRGTAIVKPEPRLAAFG